MSTAPKRRISPQEYLELERKAEFKSEYFDGEMFVLESASQAHEIIVHNLNVRLGNQLIDKPCQVYGSSMKVLVQATGLYAYPDVSVVCDEPKFSDEWTDVLLNPDLVVEVLSESTEKYDRGTKFHHYQNVVSLKEYLLVSQKQMRVEQFVRQPNGRWLYAEFTNSENSIVLPSINCELDLRELYHKVDIPKQQ